MRSPSFTCIDFINSLSVSLRCGSGRLFHLFIVDFTHSPCITPSSDDESSLTEVRSLSLSSSVGASGVTSDFRTRLCLLLVSGAGFVGRRRLAGTGVRGADAAALLGVRVSADFFIDAAALLGVRVSTDFIPQLRLHSLAASDADTGYHALFLFFIHLMNLFASARTTPGALLWAPPLLTCLYHSSFKLQNTMWMQINYTCVMQINFVTLDMHLQFSHTGACLGMQDRGHPRRIGIARGLMSDHSSRYLTEWTVLQTRSPPEIFCVCVCGQCLVRVTVVVMVSSACFLPSHLFPYWIMCAPIHNFTLVIDVDCRQTSCICLCIFEDVHFNRLSSTAIEVLHCFHDAVVSGFYGVCVVRQ